MSALDVQLPPGYSSECHPELFIKPLSKSGEKKPGQLSDKQLEFYYEHGYVLVEDYFEVAELEKCKESINKLVDDLANRLYDVGKIKNKYDQLGLFHRLAAIEKEFPGANILLHKQQAMPESFQKIGEHSKILNLLEDIIGNNITFNAVWNLRTKTPGNSATTVPWHQDVGYLDNSSYGTHLVTAWIPFLDTDEINGTLQFVKGGHKKGRVATHTCCAGPTWYIMLEDDEMTNTLGVKLPEDIVTINVKYGSFILFNNYVPHRSLMNNSDIVRWSIDFRWQATGTSIGFYGIKPGCEVKRHDDPNFTPDWSTFNSIDRNKLQQIAVNDPDAYEEFNTKVAGPWMEKWHIVHENEHTKSFHKTGKENYQMLHG